MTTLSTRRTGLGDESGIPWWPCGERADVTGRVAARAVADRRVHRPRLHHGCHAGHRLGRRTGRRSPVPTRPAPGVPTGRKPIVLVRGTLTQATTPQGASAIHWTSTDAGPNTWIRVDPPARLTAGQGYQVSVTVQGTGDVYLDFWNGNQDLAGQTVALTSAPDTHPPGRHAGFGGHAPAELTRTRRLKPQVTAPRPGQRPRGGGAARNGHLARGRQVW